MTREETKKAAEIMQHFADGGNVEYKFKPTQAQSIWKKITVEGVYWDWVDNDYRIAQPEPVSIPITEEDKKEIVQVVVKTIDTELIFRFPYSDALEQKERLYFLNHKTQCWEEWSEELERELMK